MKLERIRLKNFRQYAGEHRLTFASQTDRNVTIVQGPNGSGKTSLFSALNWCLYGRIAYPREQELISKAALQNVRGGGTAETSAELTFQHEGERFIIARTLSADAGRDGAAQLKASSVTMIRTRSRGDAKPVDEPEYVINAILPENVRTYFFFDGERIDEFARPEKKGEVENAIKKVLKLELLTKSQNRLNSVAAELRVELRNTTTGEDRELVDRDIQLRREQERLEKRQAEIDEEIAKADRAIEMIDKKLQELQGTRELQLQRAEIQRSLSEAQTTRDGVLMVLRDTAVSSYFVLAAPAIERALAFLDEKRARGEIPGSIRRQFVEDLVLRLRCICGRPFTADGPEHAELLSLLDRTLPGSIEDDVVETSALLRSFPDRTTRHLTELWRAGTRDQELIALIEDLDVKLAHLSNQIGEVAEEPAALEERRSEYDNDIRHYQLEKGGNSRRLSDIARDLKAIDDQIARAQLRAERGRRISRRLSLAQSSADAIGAAYNAFADRLREQIEASTKMFFNRLVWKGSQFTDIKLGPDYDLKVIDRWGLPARPDLSAGERQVLSLSFIAAMQRVSGDEAPLVMDTPFGRLSSRHRETVTEHLPMLTHQLILFVTDEELRDQARRNLEGRIGAEYRLHFSDDGSTTIEEVAR